MVNTLTQLSVVSWLKKNTWLKVPGKITWLRKAATLLFYKSYTFLPLPLETPCILPILSGHGARGKLERCCMGRMAEAKYQATRFNIKILEA